MSGLPNNFIELLENNLASVPDQLAYSFLNNGDINSTTDITFRELDQRARTIAAFIQQRAKINDRILLVYAPGIEFICAFLGCLYAGTMAVPTYPPQAQELAAKLQLICDNSQPSLCLTTTDIIYKLKQLDHSQHTTHHDKFQDHTEWHFAELSWLATDHLPTSLASHWHRPQLSSQQLALLQYTSGSTGDPKGVMVSHGNLIHNLSVIYQKCGLDPKFQNNDFKGVSWLPPYHDMGLIGAILLTLYGRYPSYLMSPMAFLKRPLRWLQTISHFRAKGSVGPNFAYELCVEKISDEEKLNLDLSCWEIALNGAEPIRTKTIERFSNAFASCGFRRQTFYPCYGMAETTLLISGPQRGIGATFYDVDQEALKNNKIIPPSNTVAVQTLVSSGQPDSSYQLRIVDADSMRVCGNNEVGEIWVSGASVTQGYWELPEATKENFQAYLPNGEGPFFRTGDLGFLNNNELFITGRLKDLIIIRGRNYYPQDIEANVERCHPLLKTGGTVAFATEANGEERLVVVTEIKATLTHEDVDNIFNAIKQVIAEQHRLRVYAIVLVPSRTLKKTTSGKIRRRLIREQYINGKLKTLHVWVDKTLQHLTSTTLDNTNKENILSWLLKWTAAKLNLDPGAIDPAKSLAAYGFDSILLTQLTADLEKTLGFAIDPLMIAEQPNVIVLAEKLASQQNVVPLPKTVPTAKQLADYARIDKMPGFIKYQENKARLTKFGVNDLLFNVTGDTSRDTILINQKRYINYSGYNYLGMSGNTFVNNAAIDAINKYGTSVSASRLVAGEKPIHGQLEQAIADLTGVPASLVFSAGHATNVSTISHLFGPNDLIIHDILIHNSALQGAIFSGARRIAFPHNDCAAVEQILKMHRANHERVLILTEGVFSMDGDIPNIPKLIELKKRYHAFLMVDEAHSIGTLGKTGAGIHEYFGIDPNDVDIWMGTLSKSLGSCGGYIAGSRELIEYLKFNNGGFVYSAGISPANTAAALASIELLKREPQRVRQLQQRSQLLLERLNAAGINTGHSKDAPIIPVIVGSEANALHLSFQLKQHGIYALPIFYPAVEKNAARVRLFINCTHTEEQIHYTADTIIAILQQAKVAQAEYS